MHMRVDELCDNLVQFCMCCLRCLDVSSVVKRTNLKNSSSSEEPDVQFVENALRVVELHPNGGRCQNCRNLSVLARATTRCPFQPTNMAVWKMEGAKRKRNLMVVSKSARWLRLAFYNGDFAIAIMCMLVDCDGDTRMIA